MSTNTINDTAERTSEHARVIIDDQGMERRAYSVDDFTVVFRARDEMPSFSGGDLASLQPILLTADEVPHQQDKRTGFREYAKHVAEKEEKHGKVLVANATPVGLIDLATTLRGDATTPNDLATLRANFMTSNIGDNERVFLDRVAASVFFDDETERGGIDVTDGLMDVVRALNGSVEAQNRIQEKLEKLEAKQEHHVLEVMGEVAMDRMFVPKQVSPEALTLAEQFILVRTTSNAPEIGSDGVVHMRAAADHSRSLDDEAVGRYDPRGTVHFAVNHFVQSHMDNDFNKRDYVVIAPLRDAIEANGAPATMAGVDTFFAKGPNETVDLPGAIVIEAGGNQEELFTQNGNLWKFKSEGFKKEQLGDIYESLAEYGDHHLNRIFYKLGIMIPGVTYDHFNKDQFISLLSELPDDEFNAKLAQINQRLIVQGTIQQQGVKEAQSDGMSVYTTIDPELAELSKELRLPFELHSTTPYWWLEERALENLWRSGKENHNLNDEIKDLPPSIQRLYIHDGLLSVSQRAVSDTGVSAKKYSSGV